jgi:hypothetical protein
MQGLRNALEHVVQSPNEELQRQNMVVLRGLLPSLLTEINRAPKTALVLADLMKAAFERGVADAEELRAATTVNAFDESKHPRDSIGRFAEIEEARGRRAMLTAIQQQRDAISAMNDPELGPIDFIYEGRGNKGVKWIVADSATHAPHVIAHGTKLARNGNVQVIVKDGWRVVLTKSEDRDRRHWLLTAYLPDKGKGDR